MEIIQSNTVLSRILDWCRQQDATDLHAQAGLPYAIRVHGKLSWVPTELFPPPTDQDIYAMLRENFSPEVFERIKTQREVDLSFYFGTTNRYRANFSKQKGQQSFSFRVVPQQRLKLKDLQLPSSLTDITRELHGLVLIAGPTGQGKSTTARALIQELNETQSVRIITIEDPIEYVFEPCLSQFEQREVGIDTDTFARGIRNAIRQDPNVIFVGEIRDRESTDAALQASETGHLVLTTLHADTVAQAIGRIREFYPSSEQPNISSLLARNIHTIICQRLVLNVHGTQTPCLEIMKRDWGVQEAIQTNNLHMLTGIIEVSVGQGMHTFDQYLIELLAAAIISRETAERHAVNKHKLDLRLRGIVTQMAILKPNR